MDFAVIGAYALYSYGYVRATCDIDFLTELQAQKSVIAFLENLGFKTTHCSSAFSNHVHPVGSTRVDIMYVEGDTAREMFDAARNRLVFEDKEVPVVCPEHLIALKLFAAKNNPNRRLRDLADIKEIVARTELSGDTVRTLFQKYGLERYYSDATGEGARDG